MTGRDLIIYILKNNLEDEPIFKDGSFIGFISMDEAAVKLGVGVATIYALLDMGKLDGIRIGEEYLVCADSLLLQSTDNK